MKLVPALLVLLLAMSAAAQNCRGCRPAEKVATCTDYHCYRCRRNEVLNLDTFECDCKEGFYRVNGRCAVCPEGYVYDEITQWCTGVNPCGPNQVLVNGVCQCQPGLVVIQNICQRCPVNQTYYPQYDACRCSPGFSLVDGDCILVECKTNEVYSESAQACVCAFGFYLIRTQSGELIIEKCDRCKKNEAYNSITKTCSVLDKPTCGFNEYFYECCCFCENGYVRIGGQCVTCPRHSSYDWNLNACVCDEGYYFVGEEVKVLPYQSQDTGSSFTSNPAYIYSAYGPSLGAGGSATITQSSNYDGSGINTNGPNINNVYVVHPQN
jgi:hypothetical protein